MGGKGFMSIRFRQISETVVTVAIILVLVQTLLDDAMVLAAASWEVRRALLISGFVFDLFFTLEFLIRSWDALTRRAFRRYFFLENGWIDFIASIPLLILTSGPAIIALGSGTVFVGSAALFGLLKVVKAVRMARVLRLLRVLKVFRHLRFTDSRMVQRHTVRIVTTAATTIIFSVTLLGAVFGLFRLRDTEEVWISSQSAALSELERHPDRLEGPDAAADWALSRPSVLLVQDNDWTLYARYTDELFRRDFGPSDYTLKEIGPYRIWFDMRALSVSQSQLNLTIFLVTLAVIVVIMLSYSPHFAITVGDPVNVMLKGLREKSYNLEVSIPEAYRNDDMFRLAAAYNEEYLPLKERDSLENDSPALDISLDDISDLLE